MLGRHYIVVVVVAVVVKLRHFEKLTNNLHDRLYLLESEYVAQLRQQ